MPNTDRRTDEQIAYVDRSHAILCEVGQDILGLPMPEYRERVPEVLRRRLAGLKIDTGRMQPTAPPSPPKPPPSTPDTILKMSRREVFWWALTGGFALGMLLGYLWRGWFAP